MMPKQIREYNLDMAQCRDLGHHWEYQEWNGSGARTLRCSNCGTSRKDRLEEYLVSGRSYTYVREYHIRDVPGEVILRQLRRMLHQSRKSR